MLRVAETKKERKKENALDISNNFMKRWGEEIAVIAGVQKIGIIFERRKNLRLER